jgi:glycosyltransferase involved in cell wall biosynthesis
MIIEMKIAQVAPLIESIPPQLYGGTERVVYHLTEELVKMGHSVTLFASGDSVTSARLFPICRRALRLDERSVDQVVHHILMLEKVFQHASEFDVIHFHCDYLHFPLSRRHKTPHVTTLHGRLDIPDLVPLYREFFDIPVVSISNSQRAPLPWLNWQGTVYHGYPPDQFSFQHREGEYLAYLGRISPEKGIDQAVEIAKRFGMPLRVAAKVDKVDEEYYRAKIKPLFRNPLVEYVGEISENEKSRFLGGAYALLFPINWPEPFGLVMIESMACGTPIVAYPGGSVKEVMQEGVTGFVVQGIEDAVKALKRIPDLSRRKVREVFESRFSSNRMAGDYLKIYESTCQREASEWEEIYSTGVKGPEGKTTEGEIPKSGTILEV